MAKGFTSIAGIDEVGRGPLAGPVVSAAVILPHGFSEKGITDSKKLSPKKREHLYQVLRVHAVAMGIGMVYPSDIDRINILNAALCSMALAVRELKSSPDFLLIDGPFSIGYPLPQQAIPKGDARSISIASASIIAKVTRDRLMMAYHDLYPDYGFDRHKGYPTKAHQNAIRRFGPCPIHRKTFQGVRGI